MTTWRFRLLPSTAVSLLALMATGSVAYADCQPDPANDGDTVTCTATDDDGFATSAANLNINVENGATVAGLSTGNSNSVVVDGSVVLNNAQAKAAIQMTTSNLIVHPSGTVSITGDGVHGVQGFSADTIENQGQITAEGTNSFAVGISASDPSSIVNSGGITVSQSADGAFATAIAADALVTVQNAGTISVNADSGTARGIAILSADQAHPIENLGTISVSATNGQAIGVGFDNYGYFTNDGGINVTGNQATAISTGTNILGPSRVFNNGSITASASAGGLKSVGIEIVGTSGNTFSLENSGTISADIAVREVTGSIPPGGSNDAIDNTGTIAGDITLFMGNDVISNSNTIIGNVTFGSGDDTLTNSGTINGSVTGGPGNDTLNASTGILHGSVTGFETINGNLSLGAGDDRFDNPGTVDGNVDMGAGNDVFIARSSTVVNGNLTLGAGDDVILLSNDHPDFSFVTGTFDAGSGINTTGRVYESSADGTLDDDGSGKPYTMAIFGAGTTVTLQPQADFLAKSIVVYGDGTLDNSRGVTVSDGVAVDLADPGLTFINRGGLTAPIAIRSLQGGATVSSLTPIRGDVVLQGASNTFTSTASIEGNVTFGPGDDTFQTQGEVTGTIEGGAGNDTLIVDGDATFASDIYDFETFRTTSSAGHIEIQGGAAFRSMELAGPSPSASVVIPASGELLGAGDVTNVINEGTLIPGYIDETGFIPGILHVDGRYVQTGDNSTLFIVVDGARNSRLDVTGQASLNGQLLIYLNPSSEPVSPGARYTILHADGGVLNDFSSGMVASTTFFDVYYTVDANDVTIEFDLSSFATPFLNSNEQAFARAMTRALQSRTTQGTAATFINTLAFSERSQAAAAIDQLIPQAALNMATPALVTHRAFLGSIAEKAREYGPDFGRQGHWWSWASGFGQFGDVSGGGTVLWVLDRRCRVGGELWGEREYGLGVRGRGVAVGHQRRSAAGQQQSSLDRCRALWRLYRWAGVGDSHGVLRL